MTQPLGYYCPVTPGDGSFLDHLQNQYGSTFEKLTKLQKLSILSALIQNLVIAETHLIGDWQATEEINSIDGLTKEIEQNLVIGEHLSLADAIVNQLKYQR